MADLAAQMGLRPFTIYDWRKKDPTFPKKLLTARPRRTRRQVESMKSLMAATKALTVRTPKALDAGNGAHEATAAALSFVEGVNVGVALRDLQSEVEDLLGKELSRSDVSLFASKLETVLQVLKSN